MRSNRPGASSARLAAPRAGSTSPSFAQRLAFTERARPWSVPVSHGRAYGYSWLADSPRAGVVLIHGLQSHAQWFAEAAERFLGAGITVYALDRKGSGSSPGVRGDIARYQDWFDEIDAAVAFAGREQSGLPIHLVGHCFGANLGLGYCLAAAPDVRSLVMLTPGLYITPDYTLPEKLAILGSGLMGAQRRFRVPQDDGLFTRDPEVLAWIKADGLGARAVTARCLLEVNRMGTWLRLDAGKLAVPLLVLAASRDRIADNKRSRQLLESRLGRRCRWVTFEAEHFLLAEPCRDDVIAAIVDWIDGGSAQAGEVGLR